MAITDWDRLDAPLEAAVSERTSPDAQGIAGASRSAQGVLDGNVRPGRSETADEFAQAEAARVGVTVEHFLTFHDVVACACGEADCPGWKPVYKFRGRRAK